MIQIRNFGNTTSCQDVVALKHKLLNLYQGKSVTIQVTNENGMKQCFYVDVSQSGDCVNDSYTLKPFDFNLI